MEERVQTAQDTYIVDENAPTGENIPTAQNASAAGGYLKWIGILMIAVGAAALIVSMIADFGIALIIAAARQSETTVEALGIRSTLLLIGGAGLTLNAVAELVTGIIGCVNGKKRDQAGVCLIWGIVSAALCVCANGALLLGGGNFNPAMLALGLVLPLLFIIGAAVNRK